MENKKKGKPHYLNWDGTLLGYWYKYIPWYIHTTALKTTEMLASILKLIDWDLSKIAEE